VVPSPRRLVATVIALLALAVSAVPTFAADEPVLTGTVVDAAGQPFPVENGRMMITAPDGGGIHGAQVSVGGDGSFEVALMPWGTDATPAEVTITITGVVSETVVNDAGCTDQFAPVAEATFDVALESGGEPEPVALVAEQQLIGTVCGAGGTPVVTLPPSEVEPPTQAPTEPPAVVEPVTPAPSAPLAVLEPVTPTDDSATPPWLLMGAAGGIMVVLVLAGWRLLAGRSKA
jgi:hypothetical protein